MIRAAAGGSLSAVDSIWTVGHSNRPLEAFLEILKAHDIRNVIDVRRFPTSRKWPHFDRAALEKSLDAAQIAYSGMPELAGRRKPRPDSPHPAWRVEAFRGYADFMDTAPFDEALERLERLARERRSVVMCAEALPWRCHRSLIGDALIARGWEVFEILSEREPRPRRIPEFARIEGQKVVYDL